MKLMAFRVQNFRSVADSGWIEVDEVTALIGTNESGKTNLLLPLWKLKPAKEGKISAIADYPRKDFHTIRALSEKPIFISARFAMPPNVARRLADLTAAPQEELGTVIVHRDFDGGYSVEFPDSAPQRDIPASELVKELGAVRAELAGITPLKTEEDLKQAMLSTLDTATTASDTAAERADVAQLKSVRAQLGKVDLTRAPKTSALVPRFQQVLDDLGAKITSLSRPGPEKSNEAMDVVIEEMPAFVYYSNYGNLDSEIYLPHVIQNLKRTDLGPREAAKTRTLKVLFDFVNLSPQEIWELGAAGRYPADRQPTDEEIEESVEKTKQREILLQSASADLTKKFRDWWKQGDYRFRFQADGDHFRIWVADERRPEEVELEGRSTGLQWFLSFYLVFLVERSGEHEDAILLLDEAGLSLHPLAQKDLSAFFENLSRTNQLIYTTHSPFLVDPDHLDRVRKVYVDDDGSTRASADLRAGEPRTEKGKSVYAVHAALGLSVSEALLQGAQPVIVEGTSDQFYLTGIKNYLIGKGRITPQREILFPPAGGVRGVRSVASILTAKGEELPFVVLDSDTAGEGLAKALSTGLYQGAGDRIVGIGDLVGLADAEIEDLFPLAFLAREVSRYLPRPSGHEDEFEDVVVTGQPIAPQVEAYAAASGIELEEGWKVEVAKRVKARLIAATPEHDPMEGEDAAVERWVTLFDRILAGTAQRQRAR